MQNLFSVVIPTLNSERTLEICLKSIVNQSIGKENIEILVIDGGSKDRTREIATAFGARILDNEMVQPEYAKYHIGIPNSTGKFVVFLDSDEIVLNQNAFEERVKITKLNPKIKFILFSGYITDPKSHPINLYTNSVGDPFAFFIYNNEKSYKNFYKICKKFYLKQEYENFITLEPRKLLAKTLLLDFASSISVEREILLEIIKIINDPKINFSQIFYKYIETDNEICLPKEQPILHLSSESLKRYFSKIDWKVKINLIPNQDSSIGKDIYIPGGFLKREKFLTLSEKIKKYLFIPYSISIILPLVDGTRLAIRHRNLYFLIIHTLSTIYTSISIVYHLIIRMVGMKSELGSYGGK